MQDLEQFLADLPDSDEAINSPADKSNPSPSANGAGLDLQALTKKVYALFIVELRLERERGGPYQPWR